MIRDLTELNKLEEYLKVNGILYERVDDDGYPVPFDGGMFDRHQIIVYNKDGKRMWDAVCHYGSYGADEGLLEVMGIIVDEEIVGDTVEGNLTAEDIIKRIEEGKEE